MELPAGFNRRYAFIATFLLVTVWFWVAIDRPYSIPSHITWNTYSNTAQSPPSDIFDFPPLTSPPILKTCEATQWIESVVFICNEPSGNVAEVRNSILSCVRYAMAAGGSLVVPRIVVGGGYGGQGGKLGVGKGNSTDMAYLFDTAHFVESLRLSCPQMRVYRTAFNIKDGENATGPVFLQPETLIQESFGEGERFAEGWKKSFYAWLKQYQATGVEGPVIIQLGDTYLKYPLASDGTAFHHFGKIMKIRADIRELASTALVKLTDTYDRMGRQEPLLKNVILGAYLSTESTLEDLPQEDRSNADYATQSSLYLDHSLRCNLSVIYVASSSSQSTHIPQFLKDASHFSLEAITKIELLKGQHRKRLLGLTFDQQSTVDFLVLGRVSQFVGVGHSSFAWNIALRRRQFVMGGVEEAEAGPEALSDALSRIFGRPGGHPEFLASMWP
ncbi:hypothetical protein LZ554_008317 [Drepanopeziza brunnea f. sp. 'monogermtubi']|nr:hypothetical protein LZ554_008317 [Drepanopeziza brunnea f. sp. 'monogermtubi']